ncbi:2969_t:CDS:1 [Funneliformis mosseae]|uniref:2969_t:CDS:1 n=1 Tax=Funneliformis mosseae TaxID=27381 RepID=A0A9N9HZN7_FUNMO|nr:2969_t:CDS:1 [Funneliformis mosseae]
MELVKKVDTITHLITKFHYDHPRYAQLHLELEFPKFHNLEILQIQLHNIKLSTIVSIIENNRGNLKKIVINEFDMHDENFYEDSLRLIYTIYENCRSIEFLTLSFFPSESHFIKFEELLKTCQKLKVLLLIYDDDSFHDGSNFDPRERLSNILIRSAPISLREIGAFYEFSFSLKSLDNFLDSWRGRPALSILVKSREYSRGEYLKIFDKHKDHDVIKEFKFGFTSDIYFLDYDIWGLGPKPPH